MRLSLLNRVVFWVYYAPTLIVAVLLFAMIPVFILLGRFFPTQTVPFVLACAAWAENKSDEIVAAKARLARKRQE